MLKYKNASLYIKRRIYTKRDAHLCVSTYLIILQLQFFSFR